MHILITGGTSYIGRRVARLALRQGHRVTLLGTDRAPPGVERAIPWRLGQPVADAAWSPPVDAVIHIAHVWHPTGPEEDDINLKGTAGLLAAARGAQVPRFVFASTMSAREQALNRYGRVKYRTEALLDRAGEASARIGLVYGGPRQSLWGTLARISALPLLPALGARQRLQPIHVDDVADGLLRIAAGGETLPRILVLAGEPVTFGDFLREIAWRLHGRRPLLLPVPFAPLLFGLDALVKLGLPVHGLRERILGLAGVQVQSGAEDAARLGLSLRSLDAGLAGEQVRHRHGRAAEAAALLRYVLGRPANSATLRRFLRGWRRYDFGAATMPPFLQRCPPLMRIAEPLPWDRRTRAEAIRARLHAAAVLAETEPNSRFYAEQPRPAIASWLRLAALGGAEAALLVPRAILGHWLWR
jgi:nucleoside-diphosphate-sugar epimerase